MIHSDDTGISRRRDWLGLLKVIVTVFEEAGLTFMEIRRRPCS